MSVIDWVREWIKWWWRYWVEWLKGKRGVWI